MQSNAGKIMEDYEANLVLLDKNPKLNISIQIICNIQHQSSTFFNLS